MPLKEFFDVDGLPAIISGPVAMKAGPDGMFDFVTPSSVRAEGKPISREAWRALCAKLASKVSKTGA